MSKIKILLIIVGILCTPTLINKLMNLFSKPRSLYEPGSVILHVMELKTNIGDSFGSIWHNRINCRNLEKCSQDIINFDIIGVGGSNYKLSYFDLSGIECQTIINRFKEDGYFPISNTNCSKWFNRNTVDVEIQ